MGMENKEIVNEILKLMKEVANLEEQKRGVELKIKNLIALSS
mgnify:CR=1 FL=1|tara:strand:- start:2057 stop:2182 length:126 start_codon:yes stop_codon:yes gene_type:complete